MEAACSTNMAAVRAVARKAAEDVSTLLQQD